MRAFQLLPQCGSELLSSSELRADAKIPWFVYAFTGSRYSTLQRRDLHTGYCGVVKRMRYTMAVKSGRQRDNQ